MSVIGTRPQYVKLAALAPALEAALASHASHATPTRHYVIDTGQHRDPALNPVPSALLRPPDITLSKSPYAYPSPTPPTPASSTAAMALALEPVIRAVSPRVVIVYGDTSSTLAGALAATSAGVPHLAHVEAGLRSGDLTMPEERTRRMVDHVSTLLLAPTRTAIDNLESEGLLPRAALTGDLALPLPSPSPPPGLTGDYALATLHRPALVDDPALLSAALTALAALPFPVLVPAHPRLRAQLPARLRPEDGVTPGLRLLPPLPHAELISLARSARAIITDSGGLQKDALRLATPCVTLRDTTEWPETLRGGWNELVPPAVLLSPDGVRLFQESVLRPAPAAPPPVHALGGPDAAEKITMYICELL